MDEKKTRKALSTVKTRPAIMRLNVKPEYPFVTDKKGDVKEFENSGMAKDYFAKQFADKINITATVYVKDEILEFIHKTPIIKAIKA